MEILPSEYQHIDLTRDEKIFVRNIMSNEQYGYLLLATNPAMLPNENMHILVCANGVLLLKFFEGFEDAAQFGIIMPMMMAGLYSQTVRVITTKLLSNKALIDGDGKLRFSINILYVFPALKRDNVKEAGDEELKEFMINILQFPALTLCNSANGGKALIFRRFRHLPFGRVIRISRRIPA